MSDEIGRLKAAGMYRDDGGPSYVERHGHMPDKPCGEFCRGNPAALGGNGGGAFGFGSSNTVVRHSHGLDDPCPGCPTLPEAGKTSHQV